MKYINLYEDYTSHTKHGSMPISKDEFLKELHGNNYTNYSKTNLKLYRGLVSNVNYFYQDHRNIIRHSIEVQNIHVTLMSTMEQWKNFPKYNQSIIGSTTKTYPVMFGSVYEIIPQNNIQIGVCPFQDIWRSFGGFKSNQRIKLTNYFLFHWVSYTNDMKWNIIKMIILDTNIKEQYEYLKRILSSSMKDINSYLNAVINYKYKNLEYEISDADLSETQLDKLIPQDIVNFIENIFSPKDFLSLKYDKNFDNKLYKYIEKHETTYGLQVWLEGPALLKK